jgi:predicted lysophospholipase L1 biosynthesis ABC-type transport system permease subunit
VAVTDDLAEAAALEVGSDVELTVGDTRAVLRVVGTLPLVPTVSEGRAGVLLDADALDAQAPGALDDAPDEWWLAAQQTDAVAAALADRPGLAAEVVTRDGMLARLAADPGTGGAALADVMTVTAIGALLMGAVLLVSVVVLRRREREEQTRFLRALGASERDVTATLTTEYTLATGGGIVAGVVAGIVTASIALQATALGSGGRPLVPAAELVVPWGWTLLLLAVLLVMPMLALLGLARSGRRRDLSFADARARA